MTDKRSTPPLSYREEDKKTPDVDTAVQIYRNIDSRTDNTEVEYSENKNMSGDELETDRSQTTQTTDSTERTDNIHEPLDENQTVADSPEKSNNSESTTTEVSQEQNSEKEVTPRKNATNKNNQASEIARSDYSTDNAKMMENNSTEQENEHANIEKTNATNGNKSEASNNKTNDNTTDSERYTDSDTTGAKSSSRHTPRSQTKKTTKKSKPRSKSPKPKKGKSILKDDSPRQKPLAFMSNLMNDSSMHRNSTRGSSDKSVLILPALNSTNSINKVYVDDTEKLVNRYPKRDKDFKLEFVYDIRPKYPSWYAPEKKLSRREEKVFSGINGIYADYKSKDDRNVHNLKKKEERMKKIEKLKTSEEKEKRKEKIEKAMEQYEQLKEVREKFEILCWYRNQTQYITPRVLEHEKLSRHAYGLPETLEEQQKMIKNLRRKNKKRVRDHSNRVKSQ